MIQDIWQTDAMKIGSLHFEHIKNYFLDNSLPKREACKNHLQYVHSSIKWKFLPAVLVRAEQLAAFARFIFTNRFLSKVA